MLLMSDEDREVQARAREFADEELIPHEVEAELHGGALQLESKLDHGTTVTVRLPLFGEAGTVLQLSTPTLSTPP